MSLIRRKKRTYSDILYSVQALANVVYPAYRPGSLWLEEVYETCGVFIEKTEEPTIGQLFCIEGFLLDQVREMHQETERLLMPPEEREVA